MSAISLWPDFKVETKPRGMRQILLDAGGGLADRTNGVVEFAVETVQTVEGFSYRCYLTVRGQRYKVELCSVETGHTSFPATLYEPRGAGVGGIGDEDALLQHLARVFRSEQTKQTVLNLMANFG